MGRLKISPEARALAKKVGRLYRKGNNRRVFAEQIEKFKPEGAAYLAAEKEAERAERAADAAIVAEHDAVEAGKAKACLTDPCTPPGEGWQLRTVRRGSDVIQGWVPPDVAQDRASGFAAWPDNPSLARMFAYLAVFHDRCLRTNPPICHPVTKKPKAVWRSGDAGNKALVCAGFRVMPAVGGNTDALAELAGYLKLVTEYLEEESAKATGVGARQIAGQAGPKPKGTAMTRSRPPRKSKPARRKPSSGRSPATSVCDYGWPALLGRLGPGMDESRPVPTMQDLKQVLQFWGLAPNLARREGWPGGDDAERVNRLKSWLGAAKGILYDEAERLGLDPSPIYKSYDFLCTMLTDNPRFADKTTPPGQIAYWPQCLGASPTKGAAMAGWQSAHDGDALLQRLFTRKALRPNVATPPAAAPTKAEKTVNPTVLKAAAFIRENPGSKGRVIARECGNIEFDSFRMHIVPELKKMGVKSTKGCIGGYYFSDAKK